MKVRRVGAALGSGLAAMFWAAYSHAAAPTAVACHYTYGGEELTLIAHPVTHPYAVQAVAVGSYFQFKVVYQAAPADVAGVKIYTYADRESAPALIHQASYPAGAPYSQRRPNQSHGMPYGFTGRQWVYEPVRDGELQYWCEWKASR